MSTNFISTPDVLYNLLPQREPLIALRIVHEESGHALHVEGEEAPEIRGEVDEDLVILDNPVPGCA